MIPVTATGDGNCLFNSANLAICQKETLALELGLRTCFELAKNRQFYRNHPVLSSSKIPYYGKTRRSGVMSVETLCDLTCFSSRSSELYGEYGFEAAFDREIMRTSKNYSYSGTLQIMALASVLGVPIEAVYPDQNHKLLPVYQNIFRPRPFINPTGSEVVRILWKNTLGWPDRSKEFVVNHFVPLFNLNEKVSDEPQSSSVTGKDEAQEKTEDAWRMTRRHKEKEAEYEAFGTNPRQRINQEIARAFKAAKSDQLRKTKI